MAAPAPDRFGNVRAFTGAPADPVDDLRSMLVRRAVRMHRLATIRRWAVRIYVAVSAFGIGTVLAGGGFTALAGCLP